MSYIVDTLTQGTAETDTDFNTRVQTYINDQVYYFLQAGGSFPVPSAPGSPSWIGNPPLAPITDSFEWDVTNSVFIRKVTFAYENTYYYKFIGTTPPLPVPPAAPVSGDMAIFGTGFVMVDSGLAFDTVAMNWTNLSPATVPGQAVEYSQFAAVVASTVNTVNLVAPTLGNIQLTVSNTGTAGTLQWSGLALQIPEADTNTTGLLSFTDWNTFSAKQPAGNYITALTGDATATGPGSVALTLATVNAGVGTFGSATQAPVFTVNGKGLITAASQVTITPAASSITGGQALTRTNDTNVTLTLGGTPTTSLLAATSLTLGWTGLLSVSRGGTGVSGFGGVNTLLFTTAADTLDNITTANTAVLTTNGIGTPSWTAQGTAFNKNVGTTAGTIAAGDDSRFPTNGTWTPTLTNTTNVSASTAFSCQYARIGNYVSFSGKVNIDPTAAGAVLLEMSLPVASNFSALENAGGTGYNVAANQSFAIDAEITNDRLAIRFTAVDTANRSYAFSGGYLII